MSESEVVSYEITFFSPKVIKNIFEMDKWILWRCMVIKDAAVYVWRDS